jgi:uncharacterized protein YdeI (YjbR/CyaY-like superfamily)
MQADTCRYFEDRTGWRNWLSEHFETAEEVWFVFPKKISAQKSLSYNDAVEEALCFGWIDSTVKTLDAEHKIQRFTPRKPQSAYSQANKERLMWLLENGLIHPKLENEIRKVVAQPYVFPEDILSQLKQDPTVWENYQSFSDPYKRIRIAYIDAARKRPEEFSKRLSHFLLKTKENKILAGYGGIEKYY